MEEGIDRGMRAGVIVIEETGTGTETTATVNGAATVIATEIVITLENETTTEMPTEIEIEIEIGTDRLRQTLDAHLPHPAAPSPKQKNFHSTRNHQTLRL